MLTDEHKKRAIAEGWDIYVVWDDGKLRHMALPLNFKTSKFKNAQQLVQALIARATVSMKGDALATEALRLMGTPIPIKKTRKR